MKKKIKRFIPLILILVLALTLAACQGKKEEEPKYDEHYKAVTLHAGEFGYFGSPSVKEMTTYQFIGDTFNEEAEPDAADTSHLFLGWATSPDATVPEIFVRNTNTKTFENDLYAVWTDNVDLYYFCNDGYIEKDGEIYEAIQMNYPVGANFKVIIPTNYDAEGRFAFDGWYTGYFGHGEKYTEETVINTYETELYPKWIFKDDNIEVLELDKDYHINLEGSGHLYRFTPAESTVYEISTKGMPENDELYTAYIRLLNADTSQIEDSYEYDFNGDAALSYEMEAGKTYYFQIREGIGRPVECDLNIHKCEYAKITFHANRDGKQDAYFDGDKTKSEKVINIGYGNEIWDYARTGLNLESYDKLLFAGWSLDPNSTWPEDVLKVEGDMDVYAVYEEHAVMTLSAEGGAFTFDGESDTKILPVLEGRYFDPEIEPRCLDNTKSFAGWSTEKGATAPNVEEGEVLMTDLPDTLYAVWTDKVLVTFDANGGYFLSNPEITTYDSVKGIGHRFDGLTLYPNDPQLRPYGWTDQDGVFIPYTSLSYTPYKIKGDTTYTAVWKREVDVNANGGYFLDDPDATILSLFFLLDEPFSCEYGEPVSFDPNKEFIGWSSSWRAEEVDVIPGETPTEGLTTVYAVWGDKAEDTQNLLGTNNNTLNVKSSEW